MRKHNGFTIVELLIVIVIIGVLAMISVVAYNGVQSSAQSATVQSDLRNFAQKTEQFFVLNNHYPTSDTELESLGWNISSKQSYQQKNGGNTLYCAISTGPDASFVIAARTAKNKAYTYSSKHGLQEYNGAWSGAWASDCPLFGVTTSAPNFVRSQGYHPPTWGAPGWKTWTGFSE